MTRGDGLTLIKYVVSERRRSCGCAWVGKEGFREGERAEQLRGDGKKGRKGARLGGDWLRSSAGRGEEPLFPSGLALGEVEADELEVGRRKREGQLRDDDAIVGLHTLLTRRAFLNLSDRQTRSEEQDYGGQETRLTILAAFQNCTPLMTCFMNMMGKVTAAARPGQLVFSMTVSAREMAAIALG